MDSIIVREYIKNSRFLIRFLFTGIRKANQKIRHAYNLSYTLSKIHLSITFSY